MDARDAMAVGGCCTPVAFVSTAARVDPTFVRRKDDGTGHVDFLVPEMHCAACIGRIEDSVNALPGVVRARANLTSHRVGIDFDAPSGDPDAMLAAIEGAGYSARPFDASAFDAASRDTVGGDLARCLAVAGFAAGNIMLLSVSVWSGASDATRAPAATPAEWWLAATLGAQSRHPLARALARAARATAPSQPALDDVVEHPGDGMQARLGDRIVRLGCRDFVGGNAETAESAESEIWLRIGDKPPRRFGFEDTLRADAAETIATLKAAGLDVILLSRPA